MNFESKLSKKISLLNYINEIEPIDLSDISDDTVITYAELQKYIDNISEGNSCNDDIDSLKYYIDSRNNFIDTPEIIYYLKLLAQDLAEMNEMFSQEKISKKRLERIKEDVYGAQDTFELAHLNVEFLSDKALSLIEEIIDNIIEHKLDNEV